MLRDMPRKFDKLGSLFLQNAHDGGAFIADSYNQTIRLLLVPFATAIENKGASGQYLIPNLKRISKTATVLLLEHMFPIATDGRTGYSARIAP